MSKSEGGNVRQVTPEEGLPRDTTAPRSMPRDDSGKRTLGQRMVYLSQACDSFVFRRFRVLGHLIHDYRWQLLIIPVLLLLPMM